MNAKSTTAKVTEAALSALVPAPTTRPCACGWSVVLPGNRVGDLAGRPKAHRDAAEYDPQTDMTFIEIPCEATTKAIFAPGHDARLKGLAQTAAILGGDLSKDGLSADPVRVLQAIAPDLVRFVTEAVEREAAKAEAKAAKAAEKAAEPEAKAAKAA